MKVAGGIAVILLIVLGMFSNAWVVYGTKDTVVTTVTDKERVCSSGGNRECKYLIFTEKETFENTDVLWYFKYNSSDLYGKVKKGETYRFTVYGWRIGFLSSYRNIISAQKVN